MPIDLFIIFFWLKDLIRKQNFFGFFGLNQKTCLAQRSVIEILFLIIFLTYILLLDKIHVDVIP